MRSYDVQGSYGIANNRVAVKLDDFTTLEESIGYGKFNPILMIGENFIEKKVLERIQPVFPSSHGTQSKNIDWKVNYNPLKAMRKNFLFMVTSSSREKEAIETTST